MNSDTVSVAGYVSRPYEQVLQALEALHDEWFSTQGPPDSAYRLGEVVRVSRSVSRVAITPREAQDGDTTELRVLPVSTGRDSLTELLLVSPCQPSQARATRVSVARSMLDELVRRLDTDAPAELVTQ